jgi:CRISPR-associated protein Cas2
MVRIMVVYDISDDRSRHKVSETCLDYGLDREQFSVFTGRLSARHIKEMSKVLRSLIECGYVLIVPIASDEWQRRTIIHKGA